MCFSQRVETIFQKQRALKERKGERKKEHSCVEIQKNTVAAILNGHTLSQRATSPATKSL